MSLNRVDIFCGTAVHKIVHVVTFQYHVVDSLTFEYILAELKISHIKKFFVSALYQVSKVRAWYQCTCIFVSGGMWKIKWCHYPFRNPHRPLLWKSDNLLAVHGFQLLL